MFRSIREASPTAGLLCTVWAAVFMSGCSGDGERPHGNAAPQTRFVDVAKAIGLDDVHAVDITGKFRLPEIMGAGAAVFDADGDGDHDIYLVQSGKTIEDGAPNRLFLRDGDRYVESRDCGLEDRGYGMGAAAADIDNDGDVDVFVANWGRDALYLNDGQGRFSRAEKSGLDKISEWSTSCAFLDYDLDGLLDLWVCGYVDYIESRDCYGNGGRREFCGPHAFDGARDVLYRNLCDGRFADVTRRVGAHAPSTGLGVIVDHFDDDGRIDVYVANDQESNQLWMNRRGRLEDEALVQGVAVNGMGAAESSMGVACGDVDGDGRDDLFMTHLDNETNTLYQRLPSGGFRDATTRMRLAEPSLGLTGFGTTFVDVDNDGDLDLAIVNGRVAKGPQTRGEGDGLERTYGERNQLFLNEGAGRFADASPQSFPRHEEISRGLVPFDHDGDGDLDLLVTNCAGRVRLYENRGSAGNFVRVIPFDRDLRRMVLGARVTIRVGEEQRGATLSSTASYLSSWLTPLHFGLGAVDRVDEIEVMWPGGEREIFDGVPAGTTLTLVRGDGRS